MLIPMKAINCLLITTSNNRLGDSLNKTGVWLEDLAAPYYVFRDAGDFILQGKPIGLVGHAVVALVPLTTKNGDPLVKGRSIVLRPLATGKRNWPV